MSTKSLLDVKLNAGIMSPSQCPSVFCFGRMAVQLQVDSAEASKDSALQAPLTDVANVVMEHNFLTCGVVCTTHPQVLWIA